MNRNELSEKKDNRESEVIRKYRKVFLGSEDGKYVLTDILNELGEFHMRALKTDFERTEALIKSNLTKLILWKLGVWRTENATEIAGAFVTGWDGEKTEKGIIGRLLKLPWNKREEEKK